MLCFLTNSARLSLSKCLTMLLKERMFALWINLFWELLATLITLNCFVFIWFGGSSIWNHSVPCWWNAIWNLILVLKYCWSCQCNSRISSKRKGR
jgi:hypothetical protein